MVFKFSKILKPNIKKVIDCDMSIRRYASLCKLKSAIQFNIRYVLNYFLTSLLILNQYHHIIQVETSFIQDMDLNSPISLFIQKNLLNNIFFISCK